MKILYIEDDENQASLVRLLLKSHGYEVDHFALGKLGLESFHLGATSWDAVIVDLDLSDVSGRTLIADSVTPAK